MKHGLMRFMRAHGQTPGPGQRPRTAGALAGMGAGVLAWPVLQWTGAAASLSSAVLLSKWLTPILCIVAASLAGALYGGVFQRAASDRRGGWLFGISYGFLLWMLGPIALVQTVLGRPLATGTAAMGMLAAHLIFGLVLGLLFRQAHALVRHGLEKRVADEAADAASAEHRGQKIRFPHTPPGSR